MNCERSAQQENQLCEIVDTREAEHHPFSFIIPTILEQPKDKYCVLLPKKKKKIVHTWSTVEPNDQALPSS